MQEPLETKAEKAPDGVFFHKMKETARELLGGGTNGPYTQAIVLRSAKGNLYGARIENACSDAMAQEVALLQRMLDAEDTEVGYVLCAWGNGWIDLPSFAFRKMLCACHPKNAEALVFVTAARGVCTKPLTKTM